ncbi:transposase [bacterium]|nr:transposase [bacterium]
MSYRKWSPAQKMAIILEGLKSQTTVAEICRNHGISQTQYYKWRDQFLEGAKLGLSGKTDTNGSPDKSKIKALERIIGRQTITIEMLKKIQNLPDD